MSTNKPEQGQSAEHPPLLHKSSFSLNRTIEAGVTLSAPQRKALNALHFALQSFAKQTFESVEVFNAKYENRILDFKIPRSRFEALMSYRSRNQAFLRDALRQLSRIQVDWYGDKDGGKEAYSFTNIFMSAGVQDGYVHVRIPAETRRALVNKNVEATIDVIKLSESLFLKYSISLYEVAQGYFERSLEDEVEFEIDDELLRNSLNVPYKWTAGGQKKYSYPTMNKLKEKVLKPATKEINEADFEFKIEFKHKRLYCGTIVWRFLLTRSNVKQHKLIASEFASDIADITRVMRRYGIKHPEDYVATILSEKDVLYFQFCIDQVDQVMRSRKPENKIKNPGGYLIKALKNNTEAFEAEYEELLAERQAEARRIRREEQSRIDEQIEEETKQQKQKLRDAYWNGLSKEQQLALAEEFKQYARSKLTRTHITLLDEQGVTSSPVIRGAWANFMDERFEITDEEVAKASENMVITSTFR